MTNKRKNIYLWFSSLLLLLLAHQFSIKKTLNLRHANQLHQQSVTRATNIDEDIEKYKTQLASFNANAITSYSQENLLELLSTFCLEHNLLIKGFPEPNQYEESTYDIIVNQIEVEGQFTDIVQLIYDLEYVHKIGSIVSLKYQSAYNRQAKKTIPYGKNYFKYHP
jgi:hypothetical protein